MRERPGRTGSPTTPSKVSIHAPVRERRMPGCWHLLPPRGFNPRSREGATAVAWGDKTVEWRFNPRSREGATFTASSVSWGRTGFNPRSREGATRPLRSRAHSPDRFNPRSREGATSAHMASILPLRCFNPRSREGATGNIKPVKDKSTEFQSTLP